MQVRYISPYGEFTYETGVVLWLKKGTPVSFDNRPPVITTMNHKLYPVLNPGEDSEFDDVTYFSVEDNVIVSINVEALPLNTKPSDYVVEASNITYENINFKVGRGYWDDMPIISDWEPYVIFMDGGIKNEALLSLDYLRDLGGDEPALQPVIVEMEMKEYDYLWLY